MSCWNPIPAIERFRAKVRVSTENFFEGTACWEWQAALYGGKYGQFYVGPRPGCKNTRCIAAHRWAWEYANKAVVPEGMWVLHKCDNQRCVQPSHLFVGTPQDNVKDMHFKGRQRDQRGAKNHRYGRKDLVGPMTGKKHSEATKMKQRQKTLEAWARGVFHNEDGTPKGGLRKKQGDAR